MTITLHATDQPILQPIAGKPTPVPEWERDPDTGKNRPSNRQQTIDGAPVWEVSALATVDSFGNPEPEVVKIRVASKTPPESAAEVLGGVA